MKVNSKITAFKTALLLAICAPSGYLRAADIIELEPNNSIATAQSVNDAFSAGDNPDIQDATLWPWVSISAGGDNTFDYYTFEVPAAGDSGVFDIDYGITATQSLDTKLCLYAADGTLLASNDDNSADFGANGSSSPYDAFIVHVFGSAGTYVIGVGEFGALCNPGGMAGNSPDAGDYYELQISLSAHLAPVVNSDGDGDGVPDDVDCNPHSDLNSTVVFEGCDSGVDNTLFADGCTIADHLFACADDARNHGKFTSCLAAATNELRKSGDITSTGKEMIQSCAAQSGISK